MSDTLSREDPGEGERRSAHDASTAAQAPQEPQEPPAAPPARRGRRLAVVLVVAAVAAGAGAAAAAVGLATGGQSATHIRRVTVAGLTGTGGSAQAVAAAGETILLVGDRGSHPAAATGDTRASGLIMLLRIGPGGHGAAAVSIPPTAQAPVPGMGMADLQNALTRGSRSLLVRTVTRLTGVAVNHYAVLDFSRVAQLVDAIGGVAVTMPKAASSGRVHFHAGVNHLAGAAAVAYARAPSLTAQGRVLREQSLLQAITRAVARRHLLATPGAGVPAVSALATAMTVDSSFSQADLDFLASHLRVLGSSSGSFVTAPSNVIGGKLYLDPAGGAQLWQAVQSGSVAAFAARYPAVRTPATAP